MKLAIINGPNLNLLGVREKSIYGVSNLNNLKDSLCNQYINIEFTFYQSNIEGELVEALHKYGFDYDGIIINAGAYTHTSIAIRDAISGINTDVVEVHISNVLTREEFRHLSIIGPVCKGCILGFGLESYRLAVEYFKNLGEQ